VETSINLEALARWMDSAGLGTGPLEDATQLAGGTQNILLRFARAGRTYVLRRPPPHLRDNSNETMRREARVLSALAGSAVPHPGFIAVCTDESVLGAVFYLMEPIDGFNPANGMPELHATTPAVQHRMGLAMVEAAAALGAVDYKAVGLDGFGKPDNFLARQVARWKAQLDSYSAFAGWPGAAGIPGVEKVATWLEANRPGQFTPGIIHGDFHLANVMFRQDSGELAAIVDWELSTIGDPLLDLGWLLATWRVPGIQPVSLDIQPWIGFPTTDELVAHYATLTERDLSHAFWYGVLACYKLGCILEGTYARACAGKAPKETGDRLHAHTVNLFERALMWIG
jgi:aminoglycoside phosphotransferase (APT) family kinase protein